MSPASASDAVALAPQVPHAQPRHPQRHRASAAQGRAAAARPTGAPISKYDQDEFFGQQPTPSQLLPDPAPLVENLTRCVLEVLAGARELEQLARWVTDDVYRHLLRREVLAARARKVKGQSVHRPQFVIGRTILFEPRDGVVEAVVMVHMKARSRAVALRLEGMDKRWRASSVNVL
ncbi:MAG: Rv3235 family protein [Microbacteriaceae bacterium]